MIKKIISLFLAVLGFFSAFAQNNEPEMADILRSNGKIYTVVGVIGIILAGLFVYLLLTERKLAKIESQLKK